MGLDSSIPQERERKESMGLDRIPQNRESMVTMGLDNIPQERDQTQNETGQYSTGERSKTK